MSLQNSPPRTVTPAFAGRTTVVFFLVAAVCFVPLLVTPVLPFVDFYAHVARYFVLAHVDSDPALQENYASAWRMLPNLGVDILAVGLMKVFPPLVAARIVAFLIIFAPFAGTVYLFYVLHHRVEPLVILLAGLIAYNHVLVWGFSNYLLGLGILLAGLGHWIAARDKPVQQLVVAGFFGLILVFVHGLTFALWGLLLTMVEIADAARRREFGLRPLARRAGRLFLVAILPVAYFLYSGTSRVDGGVTMAFSNLAQHADEGRFWSRLLHEGLERMDGILRVADSTWPWLDRGIGAVLWIALLAGLLGGALRLHRMLVPAVLLSAVLVWVIPPNLFSVGHMDERVPPLLLALLAAGLSLAPAARETRQRLLLFVIAGLFLLRSAALGWGWYQDGRSYARFLDALEAHDTRKLGDAAFFAKEMSRDVFRPNCKPLLFLMLLRNGTAVSTFVDPAKQPLRIIGPLAEARLAAQETLDVGVDAPDDHLAAQAAAGFDTIVACYTEPPETAPPGLTILAAEHPWVLYATSATR